jgi:hypothetical protein
MRIALIVFLLMALSFGGGFWWEHGKMEAVQNKLDVATAQLTASESAVRLCRLQDQLLILVQTTGAKNYGDAATLSTKFFNALSDEVARATQPNIKSAMQSILAQRDQVTAELAKGDPASHDLFVQMSTTFRQVFADNGAAGAPSVPAAPTAPATQ